MASTIKPLNLREVQARRRGWAGEGQGAPPSNNSKAQHRYPMEKEYNYENGVSIKQHNKRQYNTYNTINFIRIGKINHY
jgi:hypothetical protein